MGRELADSTVETAPTTTSSTDPDTAEPTVTSEQLAQIRSGREVVSVDDDTLEAPMDTQPSSSTLEGTASSGDEPGAGWGRRAGVMVAAAALIGAAVFALGSDDVPTRSPSAAPSAPAPDPEPSSEPKPSSEPDPEPAPEIQADPPPTPSALGSADPAPSVTAAPARPRPAARAPAAPVVPPKPNPKPAPKPKSKCANPFTVDENGDLQPRPECF
jgi:hypothetical protein